MWICNLYWITDKDGREVKFTPSEAAARLCARRAGNAAGDAGAKLGPVRAEGIAIIGMTFLLD